MKKAIRLLSLFCAMLMLILCFTACGKDDKKDANADRYKNCIDPPVIYIDTDGVKIDSKETYVNAKITTDKTDKEWILDEAAAEIRLRGNYSLKVDKKSFRLKLAEPFNLFGQDDGDARNWVLIANFCDKTLIRNYLAYYMARQLDGLDFTTTAQLVEVYLNGEYQGLYLLAEHVRVGGNRVNVEEGSEDVDTGYLVELDRYLTAEGSTDVPDFFVNNIPYAIKSDILNEGQRQYIATYMQNAFDAVQSGDRTKIEQYIDMDSCIDMYIMHEFFRNPDAGYSSFYFFKDKGSKLHFGPVWDFDLAMGNDQRIGNGSPEGLFTGIKTEMGWLENHWFTSLMSQDWFKAAVNARWQQIRDLVDELIEEAERVTAQNLAAIDRNFEKWPIYGTKQNQEPAHVAALKNSEECLDYLTKWLADRKTWFSLYFSGLISL